MYSHTHTRAHTCTHTQVLHLDLTKSSLLSVLPWMTMALCANLGGWLADSLVDKGMDVTTVRKVCVHCFEGFLSWCAWLLGVLFGLAYAHLMVLPSTSKTAPHGIKNKCTPSTSICTSTLSCHEDKLAHRTILLAWCGFTTRMTAKLAQTFTVEALDLNLLFIHLLVPLPCSC